MTLGLSPTLIQAQTFFIKEKSGSQTFVALDNIRNLRFTVGLVTVNKTDGSSSDIFMSDIRYLSFINYSTGVSQNNLKTDDGLALYPNPVINELHINYESVQESKVQIGIFNIQGQLIQQENTTSRPGINNWNINVYNLPRGLYMVHLQNGNKIETIKFIKD